MSRAFHYPYFERNFVCDGKLLIVDDLSVCKARQHRVTAYHFGFQIGEISDVRIGTDRIGLIRHSVIGVLRKPPFESNALAEAAACFPVTVSA